MADTETFRIRKLVQNLEKMQGDVTSMISLILPPKDSISRAQAMLTSEYGTASNIKSRVNRLSVLGAITSAQHRLKMYNSVPPNGLLLYVGTALVDVGGQKKERKITISFEPPKPINTSLYMCDSRFHVDVLRDLLVSDVTCAFIIVDGNECLFATLSNSAVAVLSRFSVDLPKKHGRGGQSALRFARIRTEKRHNYVRKVAEEASKVLIHNDKVIVSGIIIAGIAHLKSEVVSSGLLDPRLVAKIISECDVSYGGEKGLHEAITKSSDLLANVKYIQEKKILERFFDAIRQNDSKYVFGKPATLSAMEQGAAELVIVDENLALTHTPAERNGEHESEQTFVEWLADHYREYGTFLEIVSDATPEGMQFCRGFGGLGALLRYPIHEDGAEMFEELADEDIEDYM